MRRVRIGIDVGGTFTDAVAIDDSTYEIIAKEKIATTHDAAEGVSKGIIDIIHRLLEINHIAPEEVVFIAHGTTQATNALLEGDVAKVGVMGMGSGIESSRVKSDSDVGNIPLAKGKYLHTVHRYIETQDAALVKDKIAVFLEEMKVAGAEVIVASESFGVDDPTNECTVINLAKEKGMYATGGHEVSQLYGLKVRTRTAVVNGSLIPKMMETANMTENCVKQSGIKSPLMIMRCDGGVMTVDEVRKRPILTMLSGLAAGVAGALMYEKISDGIFFEVGGTSTDISAIKNGKVMIKYAQVGGHKTYLNSLDVRTLGIAGGSMIKVSDGKISDVGPRSAHIAGKKYEAFAETADIMQPVLRLIAPRPEDEADFAIVECTNGKSYSLTLAGAANILGTVPEKDYARGNKEASIKAWQPLADQLGITVEAAAKQAMDIAAGKVGAVVESLIQDYKLTPNIISLVGGGGSGGVLVPYLGENMGYKWRIAKNAPFISTIGVALAMVREVVERTVVNPGDDDIRSIRRAVFDRVIQSGASEATVEIAIEIDKHANILRAIATGATELRTKDIARKSLDDSSLSQIAADSMRLPKEQVSLLASVGNWHVFEGVQQEKRLIFFTKTFRFLRVLDRDGVVRLQKNECAVILADKENLIKDMKELIDMNTDYGTTGGQLPQLYLFYGEKQLDMSGLAGEEQVMAVVDMEMNQIDSMEKILVIAAK
jgi:N-methylhydantoinase A/oxoprolinase/acetone carboxylase beta subunit